MVLDGVVAVGVGVGVAWAGVTTLPGGVYVKGWRVPEMLCPKASSVVTVKVLTPGSSGTLML